MLLSRFWYLILIVTAVAAGALFLLTQSAFNRQYDADLRDQLRRDRFEMELVLKVDARSRIDATAGFAAHPDIANGLRDLSSGRARDEAEVRAGLATRLTALNSELRGFAGDLLFAVDATGTIVAAHGAENLPEGSGLGSFPLVEKALQGFTRDDVWVFNEKVYRMAARPVINESRYVGAIIHGMEINDDFARRLSEPLNGTSVVFFKRNTVIGSHMPAVENAARADDVVAHLETALADPALAAGERTEPVDIAGGGAQARYFLMNGSAAHAQVGYAIARPRLSIAGAAGLLDQVSVDDLGTVPVSYWAVLIGVALFAFVLAMLFIWIEHDRHLKKLGSATVAFSAGKKERFEPARYGGRFRRVTQSLNEGLDGVLARSGGARPAANLDEILAPADSNQATPSFFGFDAQEKFSENPQPMDLPSIPAVGIPGAPPLRPMVGNTMPTVKNDGPGMGFGVVPPPPVRPAPPGGPSGMAMGQAPMPSGGGKPGWAQGTLLGVGVAAPVAAPAPTPIPGTSDQPSLHPSMDDDDDDEGATMVAAIPEELLAQATENRGNAGNDDGHFRSVFDEFVATKKQCGESVSGLTFEKFGKTLRRNRDQIMSQHGAKGVRFTVYVKAGKAALKATPVRS